MFVLLSCHQTDSPTPYGAIAYSLDALPDPRNLSNFPDSRMLPCGPDQHYFCDVPGDVGLMMVLLWICGVFPQLPERSLCPSSRALVLVVTGTGSRWRSYAVVVNLVSVFLEVNSLLTVRHLRAELEPDSTGWVVTTSLILS